MTFHHVAKKAAYVPHTVITRLTAITAPSKIPHRPCKTTLAATGPTKFIMNAEKDPMKAITALNCGKTMDTATVEMVRRIRKKFCPQDDR